MKKWMIVIIIIIYAILIGMVIYYNIDNNRRKENLKKDLIALKVSLDDYYKNKYQNDDIGKMFVFPGETNIDFDDSNLSGEAFIYSTGTVEMALYDGKYCAYQIGDKVTIEKKSINDCIVNRSA